MEFRKNYINKFINYVFPFLLFMTSIFSVTCCSTLPGNKIAEPKGLINQGDSVMVDFTCRLKSGDIVVTTDEVIVNDENMKKASIFLPFKKYIPEKMIAGSGKKGPDYGKLKSLENEILESISLVLVGMEDGSKGIYELKSEAGINLSYEDRYLKLWRKIKYPKNRKYTHEQFEKLYDRKPVLGDVIFAKNIEGHTIKVISVTENEVHTRYMFKENTHLDTPFGIGTINENKTDDYYEVVNNVYEGQLIRSGVIVGRVTEVEEDTFIIDYAHPFGFETLLCDVVVRKELPNDIGKKEN